MEPCCHWLADRSTEPLRLRSEPPGRATSPTSTLSASAGSAEPRPPPACEAPPPPDPLPPAEPGTQIEALATEARIPAAILLR